MAIKKPKSPPKDEVVHIRVNKTVKTMVKRLNIDVAETCREALMKEIKRLQKGS